MKNHPKRLLRICHDAVILLLFAISLGIPRIAAAQLTFRWARIQDGYRKDDYINDLDIDNLGNVYVAGWVTNNANNFDYFVAKYNRSGTRQWYQLYDHGGNDQAKSIVVKGSKLYITGRSQISSGFGADYDIVSFVIDTAGTIRMDSTNERRYDYGSLRYDDDAVALIPTVNDTFFVAGLHRDSATAATHFTLLKYSPERLVGEASFNSGGSDDVVGMAMVDNSDLYVAGTSTFAPNYSPVFTTLKYDNQLRRQWVRNYQHAGYDEATALFADGSGVYVTGRSVATCGDLDAATVKYSPDGTQAWVARSFECLSGQVSAGGITADKNFVYATAYHANGSQFFKYDKATGTFQMTPVSSIQSNWNTIRIEDGTGSMYVAGHRVYYDAPYNAWHLAKFDSSGALISEVLFDGSGVGNANTMARMKASNADSSLVMVGSTTTNNQQDMMIVKYAVGGTFAIDGVYSGHGPGWANNSFPDYRLDQNYPNPFNPTTSVRFSLHESGTVSLRVFDVLGREVKIIVDNRRLEAGVHEVAVDLPGLASGIYFCTIFANEGRFTATRKMVIAR